MEEAGKVLFSTREVVDVITEAQGEWVTGPGRGGEYSWGAKPLLNLPEN